MEYLMTYGWAILIIAVVLSVLFQLGVFSSGNFQPHAQAGACQVSRTAAGVSLEGQCNGLLPQYVATFNAASMSYIVVGAGSALVTNTRGLTVAMWVYPTSLSGNGDNCFDSATDYSPNGNIFIIRPGNCGSAGTQDAIWINGAWSFLSSPITPTMSLNTWYFVSLTYDGSYLTGYVNSNSISTAYSGTLTPANEVVIGSASTGAEPWQGYISNVQIYNTSLSSSEIQALYLEGIGGAPIRPQNLVGWWPLNGNVNDYSGNDNNGQVNGYVAYSSSWESGYTAP